MLHHVLLWVALMCVLREIALRVVLDEDLVMKMGFGI
jgi:hypothetical protein